MMDKARILCVDDEAIVRLTLESLLMDKQVELIFAESGKIGLEKARECLPDAILLDIMMPGMDGYEVCRQIRSDPALAEVPIVMITALDSRDARMAGLEAGADDFLTKPFDSMEIQIRIKNILRLNRYRNIVEQRNQLEKMNLELRISYEKTIEGWSQALDLRDRETEGHTLRVTEMTVKMARVVGIETDQIEHIRRGALLHDVGKLGIPDAILLKPGQLTPKEWTVMKKHPVYAYEWLSPIEYLQPALDIPYCHHERWDGSGYPRGLKGENIPLSARLFAIIDVWDAMRSERPYRRAMEEKDVMGFIGKQQGILFDPTLVEAFFDYMRSEAEKTPGQAGKSTG